MAHRKAAISRAIAGPMQSRERDCVAPVRLDALARPFRDQSRSDHHAIVAESLNLTIKPVSRRPSFKADMQPVLSARQSLDRPLDRKRLFSTSPRNRTSARPASFRDRNCVPLLGDVESDESFVTLSHGPPSVHEARLGTPEQPSFLPARKGGPPPQPANMASIRSLPTTRRRPPRASTIRLPRRHCGRSRDGGKPVGPRRTGGSPRKPEMKPPKPPWKPPKPPKSAPRGALSCSSERTLCAGTRMLTRSRPQPQWRTAICTPIRLRRRRSIRRWRRRRPEAADGG